MVRGMAIKGDLYLSNRGPIAGEKDAGQRTSMPILEEAHRRQ